MGSRPSWKGSATGEEGGRAWSGNLLTNSHAKRVAFGQQQIAGPIYSKQFPLSIPPASTPQQWQLSCISLSAFKMKLTRVRKLLSPWNANCFGFGLWLWARRVASRKRNTATGNQQGEIGGRSIVFQGVATGASEVSSCLLNVAEEFEQFLAASNCIRLSICATELVPGTSWLI